MDITCYVYSIQSINRNYVYVGLTYNVPKRFQQHNEGKERTTAPYRPFEIILVESYPTRLEARKREKYLKTGSGKEWLKKTFKK